MSALRFISRLLVWLVIVIFQIVASYLIIYLLDEIFSGVGSITRGDWLASLLVIWTGIVIGVNLIGLISLRWVWKGIRVLPLQRLLGSAIGAFIPLVILLPIGFSVPIGDTGTRFYDLITNNWQPILVQASLFAAILGYFIPGMIQEKNPSTINRTPA